MSADLFYFLGLNFPVLVLGCAIYTLLTINFAKSSRESAHYALLGIFTFTLRLPMMLYTQPENQLGQSMIMLLAALSALFFYISLITGKRYQAKKTHKRKKK